MIFLEKLNSLTEEEFFVFASCMGLDNLVDYSKNLQFLTMIDLNRAGPQINKAAALLKPKDKEILEKALEKLYQNANPQELKV